MIEFSLLSSGSRANCIFIASQTTSVLLDCGLSARQTLARLTSLGRSIGEVSAIVVSHEHSDHIRGLSGILKKRAIPVWVNQGTSSGLIPITEPHVHPNLQLFSSSRSFWVGDIEIESFPVSHDANEPVMFRISAGGCSLAVVTDLGHVTTVVKDSVRHIDALIIEANHDPVMLYDGPYPWALKQRIRGRNGHLSNEEAGKLLIELGEVQALDGFGRRLQCVVAAHISETNNTPEKALTALIDAWANLRATHQPDFLAAGAFNPTPLLRILPSVETSVPLSGQENSGIPVLAAQFAGY